MRPAASRFVAFRAFAFQTPRVPLLWYNTPHIRQEEVSHA
jgi:hypothetical protein